MKSILSFLTVIGSLMLVGCDNTSSTLGGGAIGTALGAATGYAIDGGVGGAILGGVIGGLAGGAVGHEARKICRVDFRPLPAIQAALGERAGRAKGSRISVARSRARLASSKRSAGACVART